MNGYCQEIRGPERLIPGERKQHIMMLLARLVHQWTVVSLPRRGGRLIFYAHFPLKRMLEFLRQAIDRKYHIKDTIFL